VLLAGVGDLIVTRPLQHVREQPEESLLHLLALADFTVGSLRLAADRMDLISDVVALGVDAVSLANEHAAQQGWEAQRELVEELEVAGLVTLGAGAAPEAAFQPTLQNLEGLDVAFLAAACLRPGRAPSDASGIATLRMRTEHEPEDRARLLRAVERASEMAGFVLATLHCGSGSAVSPSAGERELARAVVEAGASAVIGAGPAAPRGVEVHRGAPIFHGLGAFVSTAANRQARGPALDTAVAVLEVEDESRLAGARLVLGRLDARGEPVRAGSEGASLLGQELARQSAGWGTSLRRGGDTLEVDLR
jgi:poly-gamma-glutamate synthesis protein (capsule biosynthesis protein)